MPSSTDPAVAAQQPPRTVALVTLGCARNEVDSEELAGRLAADGFRLVSDVGEAEVALVNTCGFVEAAKRDSIDTLLAAADLKGDGPTRAVVAVGCLAERYGAELAEALPEADAVLGFDAYPHIAERLRAVLAGQPVPVHQPVDRRRLLPVSPTARRGATDRARPPRQRLATGPVASVKLANGCDRRCSFCAIPTFRGAFSSRRPAEILSEARELAEQGVRELVLVSENSTSYGKDLGDLRLLEALLPQIAAVEGIERVRVSYLQPAELRPSLIDVIAATPGLAAYFDLSFQHASGVVLRRMRRFGDGARFLDLLAQIRHVNPAAGVRSNVIVGFPGEAEEDLVALEDFLGQARLDAVGVFGYSDEDGTEAAGFDGKYDDDTVRARVSRVSGLVEDLLAQRAEDRVGSHVEVLIEEADAAGGTGRAAHQGPEDGSTRVVGPGLRVGEVVRATVTGAHGVDLRARA